MRATNPANAFQYQCREISFAPPQSRKINHPARDWSILPLPVRKVQFVNIEQKKIKRLCDYACVSGFLTLQVQYVPVTENGTKRTLTGLYL